MISFHSRYTSAHRGLRCFQCSALRTPRRRRTPCSVCFRQIGRYTRPNSASISTAAAAHTPTKSRNSLRLPFMPCTAHKTGGKAPASMFSKPSFDNSSPAKYITSASSGIFGSTVISRVSTTATSSTEPAMTQVSLLRLRAVARARSVVSSAAMDRGITGVSSTTSTMRR